MSMQILCDVSMQISARSFDWRDMPEKWRNRDRDREIEEERGRGIFALKCTAIVTAALLSGTLPSISSSHFAIPSFVPRGGGALKCLACFLGRLENLCAAVEKLNCFRLLSFHHISDPAHCSYCCYVSFLFSSMLLLLLLLLSLCCCWFFNFAWWASAFSTLRRFSCAVQKEPGLR